MHPLAPFFRYFIASVVAAAGIVKAIEIVRFEVGDAVKGMTFRGRVHRDKHRRDDA